MLRSYDRLIHFSPLLRNERPKMRLIYDPSSDNLSVRLRSGPIADSEELEDGLEILLDASGHVLGFNYADARKRLTLEELTHVTYENLSTKRRESLKLP